MSNSDIDRAIEQLTELGFCVEPEKVHIKIPDAGNVLKRGIEYHLGKIGKTFQNVVFVDGDGVEHRPYREIAEWLTDNQGRGLFLYGSCGLGKTMLGRYVLPQILYWYCNPHKITHCYSMVELNCQEKVNEALGYKILSIDDVGVEEQMVTFGQRRNVFDEIMDSAEKQGKLVIITTNLSGKDIENRYGTRTFDRIKALTKRVLFDMRDSNNNPISFRQ